MAKPVDSVNHAVGEADEAVIELVHGVMHAFRAQLSQAVRDTPHDVTHMESKVLAFFSRHPGATQSDLSQHSGRDKAQLARLIKGLRERGLLSGEPDAADRRNVQLTLTPDGQTAQRSLRQRGRQLQQQAVRGLNPADQQQLVALLLRVRANLGTDKA